MDFMPVDAKLQAILDAGKALGRPPVEQQTPAEARAERAEMMARFVPMQEYSAVTTDDRTILADGREIPVRVYTPAGDGPFPLVVFFHGGGWVAGTLETHDPYCRGLATEAGAVVVSVDYRLAPEHKFPAGLEDCVAATEWVLEHVRELGGDASRVIVGGDSAGATLATVVALLLRDKGVTKLAGQILVYPATAYYDPPTVSYLENAEGYGLTRKGMIWFWDHYLNDKSEATDPRVSPLLAPSLAGLPRALVVTAEYDVMRDEGQAYAKRLSEAGVAVTHVFAEGMNHGFATSANEFPFLPQAKDVLRQVAEWVKAGG
jgi:acetyl esterase